MSGERVSFHEKLICFHVPSPRHLFDYFQRFSNEARVEERRQAKPIEILPMSESNLCISLWEMYFFVVFMCFIMISLQVKDAGHAGNLLYKLGKGEFENVYFNYTDG